MSDNAAPSPELPPEAEPHSLLEDVYGLLTATMLMALGLVLMKTGGIVTAGVAGLALLLSYKLQLSVGLLFFLINLPFFALGREVLGGAFLLRTIAACLLIFGFVWVIQHMTRIDYVHPAFAALAGGTACGMGILMVLRHQSGVGGINIVALWLQKRRGWNVGRLHLLLDGAILLAASGVIAPVQLVWSAISVVATNLVLIAFHKPGRYLGY